MMPMQIKQAGMMELVDMRDLGSRAFSVGVRVPMPAPKTLSDRQGFSFAIISYIFPHRNLAFPIQSGIMISNKVLMHIKDYPL